MRTFAIGDVQGCYDDLMRLLEAIGYSDSDCLWFAGDLVNRGSQSLATLEFVIGLGDRARCVLGNHDLHLLAAAFGVRPAHRSDTFDDVLASPKRDEFLTWLRQLPLIVRDGERLMVHAGIYPGWTVERAEMLAEEIHQILRGDDYLDFFSNMYGNTPDRWSDKLNGADRLRVIVNCFTRMRFLDGSGRLDMQHSGPVGSQPGHLQAWFALPHSLGVDTRIYFGHWAALGQTHSSKFIALDSGCVWGNALSAVDIDSGEMRSVPCRGAVRFQAV